MTPRPRQRHGFTLLEVLIALMVVAVVASLARTLLESLTEEAARTVEGATLSSREANSEAVVRRLVTNLIIQPDSVPSIVGNADTARFEAWCETPHGWTERCAVTLSIVSSSGRGAAVVAHAIVAESLPLHPIEGYRARLIYLADARDGGQWQDGWTASRLIPLAIGVAARDTAIYQIGVRR